MLAERNPRRAALEPRFAPADPRSGRGKRPSVGIVEVCSAVWTTDPARPCRACAVADDRCVAHHPSPAGQIWAMATSPGRRINLTRCEITGELWTTVQELLGGDILRGAVLDCSESTFLAFVGSAGTAARQVIFEGATFEDAVQFAEGFGFDANFRGATFKSWVLFSGEIKEAIRFTGAVFHRSATFLGVTFPASPRSTAPDSKEMRSFAARRGRRQPANLTSATRDSRPKRTSAGPHGRASSRQ